MASLFYCYVILTYLQGKVRAMGTVETKILKCSLAPGNGKSRRSGGKKLERRNNGKVKGHLLCDRARCRLSCYGRLSQTRSLSLTGWSYVVTWGCTAERCSPVS